MDMRMVVLYKENPKHSLEFPNRAEFYVMRVSLLREEMVRSRFNVSETHGWFDEADMRAVLMRETIHPDDPFNTQIEALSWLKAQVQHRVREGFIYSASFDPESEGRYEITVLTPEIIDISF